MLTNEVVKLKEDGRGAWSTPLGLSSTHMNNTAMFSDQMYFIVFFWNISPSRENEDTLYRYNVFYEPSGIRNFSRCAENTHKL